jgi:hypothetical protein
MPWRLCRRPFGNWCASEPASRMRTLRAKIVESTSAMVESMGASSVLPRSATNCGRDAHTRQQPACIAAPPFRANMSLNANKIVGTDRGSEWPDRARM